MTAEVAVMNRFAVALAADSAVTISRTIPSTGQSGPAKVFNTANKLFTLSKIYPVGVMVNNDMAIGGVPWETVIKLARESIGSNEYDTLTHYTDALFAFIESNDVLIPKEQQRRVLAEVIWGELWRLIHPQTGLKVQQAITAAEFKKRVNGELVKLEKVPLCDSFDEQFEETLENSLRHSIRSILDLFFKRDGVRSHANGLRGQLKRLAVLWLTRAVDLPGWSGIVVAGFGKNDIYPKAVEYRVNFMVEGRVRRYRKSVEAVSYKEQGLVLPFAQRMPLDAFLTGIHPNMMDSIIGEVINALVGLPEGILGPITEINGARQNEYAASAQPLLHEKAKTLINNLLNEQRQTYTDPIKEAIGMMPIGELATVAEVFVNLTQIQQRISLETETVGGPIDVAVISKGDGFVWIKRKHYFDREYNPGFVQNYFRGYTSNK